MDWKRLLSYATGSVDQELLRRNEYLATENRILRAQIQGKIKLNDGDRRSLAEIGKRLGQRALAEVATIVKPETILGWHRRLVAQKFDSSANRGKTGRPPIAPEIEQTVLRFARENRTWGHDRIVGALANVGMTVGDRTVGAILKRHGVPPAPERRKETTWSEFLRSQRATLAATDFFSTEVWTLGGLVTFYVLFVVHLATRRVGIAGITANPDSAWMRQVARNLTAEGGFLEGKRYLLHDRDTKFCSGFRSILRSAGTRCVALPPRSPNLNAIAERFVRSVKSECVDRMILFGERSLRHALREYVAHYHAERNHQGMGNRLLFPDPGGSPSREDGRIERRERLGGLLSFYTRAA